MRKKIERFVLQDVLSETGSGSVYKADEQLSGKITRPVALKVLPVIAEGDTKAEQRWLSSLQLLVALGGHPHIVTIYAMRVSERLPWIAMEYIPTTLSQTINEQPAQPAQVVKMMRQVASGLAALHKLNPPVLHNDLTPSNILLSEHGDLKISDFGLAGPANVERTRGMATVKYAAPELLSREFGPLAPATDLYALGHIAYELALGGKLYRQQFPAVFDSRSSGKDGTAPKWMAWHCSLSTLPGAIAEICPDFPQELSRIIARLMHKPLAERYASVDDLLADLDAYTTSTTTISPQPVPPPLASSSPSPIGSVALPSPSGANTQTLAPAAVDASQQLFNADRFYVRLGGRISGPFDLVGLQQQARRGLLSRLHQVSHDRVNWRSASSVEGLFRSSSEDNT